MLEAMRKGIGTWFAKIFIGLLVLSFAVWGIADIFGGYGTQTVAKVGEIEIPADSYQAEFQRERQAFSQRLGRSLTQEETKRLGLDSQVLLRMVGDAALEMQARDLGLDVSGEAVVERVRRDPLFRDATGRFSQQRFYQILLRNNLSETELLQRQRQALIREQVSEPFASGIRVPEVLLEAANTYRNETRKLAHFALPLEKAGEIAEPSDEKLRDYYNSHKSEFRAPEYRAVDVVVLSPEALLEKAEVSDDEIKSYFERNKDRFGRSERREVLQLTFPDEGSAREAHEKLKSGSDFMDIAKERGVKESDVKTGLVDKSRFIDQAVADAIFKLPEGELSDPIKGDLSTVIAKVTKIEPAVTPSLERERDKIKKLLAADKAAASVLDIYDKIEDERAAGVTLPEIARKLDLKYLDVAGVDRSGNSADGKPVEGLSGQAALLRAIFNADEGLETDPEETPDKGFIWYNVRKITPERQKDFSEARSDIADKWRAREERRLLAKKAQELVDRLVAGESLEDIAASLELEVKETAPLKRTDHASGIPSAAIQQAFALKAGAFGSAMSENGKSRLVFEVKDVNAPGTASDADRKKIAETLQTAISGDIVIQLVRALRNSAGVTINDAVVQEAVSGRLPGRGGGSF